MRICDLAKELMTTGKELLSLLQSRGCSAKSTQANLTPELEQYLRDEIKRLYYAPAPAAPAAPAAPEPATMPLEVYRQPAYAAFQGPSNRGPARVEYGPRESVPVNFEY